MSETASQATQRSTDSDLTGQQFGDYRVLRRLGRGAMAEVYLAEQLSLHRNVALKVLKSDLATDETYIKRFNMEARAAASLVHASIVQIYEVGCVDGLHFIAQEYVQGQNLAELLDRKGPPNLPLVVAVMRQVAAALAKAAEQGIVHRDIKPENLMLAKTGEVKVADFGLARITQSTDQMKLTQVGMTMGSPLYMSPEQIEGKPLDPRSDIYSFGVTCYQMLAGRPPFDGETTLAVAVQHLRTQPTQLENLRPDLPPGLCRIVHRMLSKEPGDRYANGAEVLRELRSLQVPGMSDEWPDEFDQWNTAEMVALASARSAATQQLATVMQTTSGPLTLPRRRVFWIVVVGAFLFGAALGVPGPEPSLLQDARTLIDIERLGSAREQYEHALSVNTEEAWLSVVEYFPDDAEYEPLAKKQLAEWYLFNPEPELFKALTLCEELTAHRDPEFRAYGLAGQFVIHSYDGVLDVAAEKLSKLEKLRPRLEAFDPRMARLVRAVEQRNKRATSNKPLPPEFEEWLGGEDDAHEVAP